MGRPVTLKDVAKAAGVHFTTVSLALRGGHGLPAKTRAHIIKLAQQLGYSPNPIYRALTTRRQTNTPAPPKILYLVNRPPELGFRDVPHHDVFIVGARSKAKALGYQLELAFLDDDHYTSDRLGRYINEAQVRGVIIGAFEPGLSDIVLDWTRVPVVKIDSAQLPPSCAIIGNDQEQATRIAMQSARRLGYKRVGVVVGRSDEVVTDNRYSSAVLIEHEHIPQFERVPILRLPYQASHEAVIGLVQRWVKRHSVQSVLSNWTSILDILSSAGFSVPDDIACGCLCLPQANGQIAGSVVPLQAIGAQAVHMLAMQIKRGWVGLPLNPTLTLLDSAWHDGLSMPNVAS